ncbi:PD40 domain-containing protein [bacterium]|nr:PD40 domain-containing protein [bacterium]
MNTRQLMRSVVLFLILGQALWAQSVILTDHFHIFYYPGSENTARRVADVAEEVYTPLAAAFDAFDEVGRIYVQVHDETDFSNGYASYAQNKIEIWASDLEFELRGSHNWIRNVITHELAHIFSLKAARNKWFSYFQLNFGRYNVNPDYYFSLPMYHLNVPGWYAEGIAQFESQQNGYDSWDTHRDMLLRMAVLESDLLGYDEMGVFAGDGLHSEMIYNQGYALVNYIHQAYGEDKAEALTHHIGLFSFEKTIEKVLGIKADQLYEDWVYAIYESYWDMAGKRQSEADSGPAPVLAGTWIPYKCNPDAVRMSTLTEQFDEGTLIVDGGFLDYYPVLSPDGSRIAYVSNEGCEFALTDLRIYDPGTGRVEKLEEEVDSRLAWTPDSRKIVYVKRKENYNDLYIYDMDKKKSRRISRNLRARDPAVSPDGNRIVFVRNQDGSTNLGLMNTDGTNIRYLTAYNDGTQVYSPSWSPDGQTVVFSVYREADRDIAMVPADMPSYTKKAEAPDSAAFLDPSAVQILVHSAADERDPVWMPDGSAIVFASDWDGIFNIYSYDMATARISRHTSVIGGAFRPSLSSDGKTLVYSGYHAANYNIYAMPWKTGGTAVPYETVHRDYVRIYTGKPVRELYTTGKAGKRWALLGVTPIISLSPNFVGNRFTINTINLGVQAAVGDLFDRDYFAGTLLAGRALKHSEYVDLNYTVSGYYERRLPALLTQDRTLAPRGYGFYAKRVINDFDDQSQHVQDSFRSDLIVFYPDESVDTLANVRVELDQEVKGGYKSTYDFTYIGAGLDVPVSQRQTAGAQFMHRDYAWRVAEDVIVDDRTRFFYEGQELMFEGMPYHLESRMTLFDTRFFKSDELSLYWQYSKLKPTADAMINPRGARLLYAAYSRLQTTITDSLIYIENSGPGSGPPNIPSLRKFPVNQLMFNWIELISLPLRRHTLGLETMGIFMDQRIPAREELIDIDGYFPLRLYLGGMETLRGYPYFTQTGSKLLSHRIKYTLPLMRPIGKQIFHLYLDRLYGSVFYETGTAWNSNDISLTVLENARWLQDVGFELRLSVAHFYRIPSTVYFIMAWPRVSVPRLDIDRGDFRMYFGFRVGGSY